MAIRASDAAAILGTSVETVHPVRIQRRRTRGWRMPEGAIYVGRPSRFGNPWRIGDDFEECCEWACYEDEGCVCSGCMTPTRAVALFRADLDEQRERGWPLDLAPLRGHDLACWCPLDQPCHADVLLELANR